MALMEQLIPQPLRRVTENEYLRSEETALAKHEFRNGEIIDMAGGSLEHAAIASNLLREIGNKLKGKSCRVFGSDLRVRINEAGNYCYPDVSIICGPPEYDRPDTRTTVVNPKLIIEVGSASTETYDRGDKFTDYRRIESLEEYVLVSQDRCRVEMYYRQRDGIWAFGPSITEMKSPVQFRSMGVEVTVAEIYSGIEFPAVPTKAEVT